MCSIYKVNSHNLLVVSIAYYQICKFKTKLFRVIFMFLVKSIQIINKVRPFIFII